MRIMQFLQDLLRLSFAWPWQPGESRNSLHLGLFQIFCHHVTCHQILQTLCDADSLNFYVRPLLYSLLLIIAQVWGQAQGNFGGWHSSNLLHVLPAAGTDGLQPAQVEADRPAAGWPSL